MEKDDNIREEIEELKQGRGTEARREVGGWVGRIPTNETNNKASK